MASAEWSVAEVSAWLASTPLAAFAETFVENDIDGPMLAELVSDGETLGELGLSADEQALFAAEVAKLTGGGADADSDDSDGGVMQVRGCVQPPAAKLVAVQWLWWMECVELLHPVLLLGVRGGAAGGL